MRVLVPAKINLHLRVGAVAANGFHPLQSWMCTVGLFDTLNFSEPSFDINAGNSAAVTLTCDDPHLPTDQTNLIVRAATALRATAAHSDSLRVAIAAQKQIPSGGGLGGGSSDAAFTLLALSRLWKLNLPIEKLSQIAAKIGSDVAFFLYGSSCICSGRGEIVVPISVPSPRAAVLILPAISVPTPAVYGRFDEMRLGHDFGERSTDGIAAWPNLSAEQLLPLLVNDLEPPAFDLHPALGRIRESVESIIGRPVRMSGSGSSLFTLYDDLEDARPAAAEIAHRLDLRAIAVDLAPPPPSFA